MRIAAVASIALILALGCAGQLRSQTPREKATFDDKWAQCLNAATRACVLRHAARIAESIEDARSRVETARSRVQSLTSVADAQFKAALITDAAATLERALQLVSALAKPGWRDDLLRNIVAVQAKAGKFGAALEVARSIDNEGLRAGAIGRVAAAKGEAGSVADALQLVQAIDDKRLRGLTIREVAWELRSVAIARSEDDKIVAALKDVVAIEEEHPPPKFFTGLHHPSEFGPPLCIIAMAQARAGKIAEALQVARSVRDKADRAVTLTSIGLELANGGQIRQALVLVRSVDDHTERGWVLDRILDQVLEPQWTRQGWGDLTRPNSGTRRTSDKQPAKVEGAGEAVRIAMTLPEEQRSLGLGIVVVVFLALLAIGKAQAKAGLPAESIATFDQALQAALSFVPRDRYLSRLAKAQAAAGQIGEALNVTKFIEDTEATAGGKSWTGSDGKLVSSDYNRRGALYEIARAQAKAGLIADALQTARFTELLGWRILHGLGVVAEGLAEVGRIEDALSAAESVENPYRRARLLASIAKSQAAAGKHAEALQIAQNISQPKERIEALVAAAAAQARAGLIAEASATCREALQVAESLRYKGQIVSALVAIAGVLPN